MSTKVNRIKESALTLGRLKFLLAYEPETGLFRWKNYTKGKRPIKIGALAGCKNNVGYIKLSIDNQYFLAHRVVWFYVTGKWPQDKIDHINCNRSDNRFSNLRDIKHWQNIIRQSVHKNSKFPKGVTKNGNRFCARISVHGGPRYKWLGNFRTIEEAEAAYIKASLEIHGRFSTFYQQANGP